MRALLRYAILKSAREKLLAALLVAPAVMLVAPFLGGLAAAALMGPGSALRPKDFGTTQWAGMMATVGAVISSLSAGVGGFWIFRREMANHSLGSFALASRPHAIALAATIYGTAAGMLSFLILAGCTTILTQHLPPHGTVFVAAFVSSLAASALGAALITVSSETTMLVPVYAGSLLVSILLVTTKGTTFLLAALAASALLVTASSMLMRRRCAI
jgi:hypothetical protein